MQEKWCDFWLLCCPRATKGALGQQMSPRLKYPLSGLFVSKGFFSPTSTQAPISRGFGAMHMLNYAEANALPAVPNTGAGGEMVPNRSSIQGTHSLLAVQLLSAWRRWRRKADLTVILDKQCGGWHEIWARESRGIFHGTPSHRHGPGHDAHGKHQAVSVCPLLVIQVLHLPVCPRLLLSSPWMQPGSCHETRLNNMQNTASKKPVSK